MTKQRKRRLFFILLVLLVLSAAVALMLRALSNNINLYVTPSRLLMLNPPSTRLLRLGGFVEKGTVVHHGLHVQFTLTDFHHSLRVEYTGLLPTLFRVGQGIVTQGHFSRGRFIADQVLAKHNAVYHPPGISRSAQ